MSSAEVSREGLGGVRPGREARTWSHEGGDGDGRAARADGASGGASSEQASTQGHTGSSYYGKPIINPPVWEERDIAGYLFTGGLAAGSSVLAAGAELTGRPALARASKLCASGAIGVSLVALVHDLGRPARFVNMLRVFKPTSPMNMGSWLLGVYGPLNAIATATDVLGVAPRAGRAASVAAALTGSGVSSYTAALIANTAVPAWHEGHRELPFVFAGSAAAAGAGFGMLAAPVRESEPARRLAVAGVAAELVCERLLERRLGMVAETLHEGVAGRRMKLAKALTAAGAVGAATLASRSRLVASLSGAALLAGSAFTRFGVFAAGMASAEDPKYTVEPQRRRLAERAAADAAQPDPR
ncbi:MAG TPA: NrfD/PsrC family molybdoenzyme membrane anchor subunit [Solirubrobacteraceae bacterium]|nr:NrfD/PsrC family molybdoenzyme membrane anchor subunit [Solirubrobacteraceae bacterium]